MKNQKLTKVTDIEKNRIGRSDFYQKYRDHCIQTGINTNYIDTQTIWETNKELSGKCWIHLFGRENEPGPTSSIFNNAVTYNHTIIKLNLLNSCILPLFQDQCPVRIILN